MENTIMLGKNEGSQKRGSPNTRWINFIKEAISMSLQKPSGAVEDNTFRSSFIHRVARS